MWSWKNGSSGNLDLWSYLWGIWSISKHFFTGLWWKVSGTRYWTAYLKSWFVPSHCNPYIFFIVNTFFWNIIQIVDFESWFIIHNWRLWHNRYVLCSEMSNENTCSYQIWILNFLVQKTRHIRVLSKFPRYKIHKVLVFFFCFVSLNFVHLYLWKKNVCVRHAKAHLL